MKDLKLNETPIRTSRNYNINNVKLKDIIIPEKVEEFENLQIINETIKNHIDNRTNKNDLTYGISDLFTNQVNDKANKKINIEINSKINKEIIIDFKFDNENKTLIDNIQILANENTKSTIIIKYESQEDIEYFHNGIINIKADKNANVNVIIANLINEKSNNFIAVQNILYENSKVNYTIIDFGGKNSVTNYYSNLQGEFSQNAINTIYLGKENQYFDLNYIGELKGEKTNIDIQVQGALKDNAKKHFKGTIDFKKGCKKARGNEDEHCMLLSEKAKSITLPMLLCSEEDVEGNHSCACGKIGDKELFYIMSRGFELKEAMKLMVRAKFNKVLENIKNEQLRNHILYEIDKRLD